ncbi:hypothetical protein SAMN05661044_01303 [Olivibacter domesticus]|uniref:Uncharacterized protein n=1 Tax=Olivibacter domesticus TaxID=407022 RepID=A0A1H7KEW3_OLID1|nr:hypothetical protein SAMN05661044_01303 [Olivibacter domesticus]
MSNEQQVLNLIGQDMPNVTFRYSLLPSEINFSVPMRLYFGRNIIILVETLL